MTPQFYPSDYYSGVLFNKNVSPALKHEQAPDLGSARYFSAVPGKPLSPELLSYIRAEYSYLTNLYFPAYHA